MNNSSTYRLWSSYLLLILVLWTSKGQAMDQLFCACAPSNTPAIASCCQSKSTAATACTKANKACEKNPQLSDCCCDEETVVQALLPVAEQSIKGIASSAPAFLPILPSAAVVSYIVDWAITAPVLRQYSPPILCKDVPILVQSFLL